MVFKKFYLYLIGGKLLYNVVFLLFSRSVMSNSLWPHGLQHTRLSCPTPPLRVHSNSCPLSCCCSVTKSRPTLCDPMDCNTPGFPVLYYLLEFAQTLICWVGDTMHVIRYYTILSHPLLLPSLFVLSLSQLQSLFQQVTSSLQVVKILELQRQYTS